MLSYLIIACVDKHNKRKRANIMINPRHVSKRELISISERVVAIYNCDS